MTEVTHSRRALQDLERIWIYIATDNEAAADKLLMELDRKMQRLADFPESGVRRDDISAGLRMLVHGRYVALYEFDGANDIVEIVAVLEGDRDLQNLI